MARRLPSTRRRTWRAAPRLFTVALLLAGCAGAPAERAPEEPGPPPPASQDRAVYQRAEIERVEYLEREVERLGEDLRHAEEAMIAIESGLRANHTRADAVSALAEARIAVERAGQSARWRPAQLHQARAKLEEAEKQLHASHSGSAVFFASRARRIAETLIEEAEVVARSAATRFVKSRHVNVRTGPSTEFAVIEVLDRATPVFVERREGRWMLVRTLSGRVGWIHGQLLQEAAPSATTTQSLPAALAR